MKYKVNQYLLRVVPLILVCCMFFFIFSPCVSASGLDYNDYVSNVMVDGNNDIVTVSFPTSYAGWVAYENLSDIVGQGDGESQWFYFTTYNQWQIYCNFPSSHIDVSNIPNGTRVGFGVDLVIQRTTHMPINQSFDEEVSIVYVLKDGTTTSQRVAFVTETRHEYEFTYGINFSITDFSLEIPNNAESMYLEVKIRSHSGDVGSWACKCTAKYFDMEMKISSLYRQQQLSGKTNKLLEEVNRQLEEQGEDLDQIINGSVDPTPPPGSDSVGGLDDLEEGLRDDSQAGLDAGLDMQQSALDILAQYATSFAVVGLLFDYFANLTFFRALLVISVSVGLFSVLLNLGFDTARAGARKKTSSAKTKGG